MKRKFKVTLFILSAPFMVTALYVGFLWVTYIDHTVTSGQKYGFTIGTNKDQTYKAVAKATDKHPKLFMYITYGPLAGDHMAFLPTPENYNKAQNHNYWSLLLDGNGEFFNVIKLKFENEKLSEIYRHRKYFEAP